MRRQRLCGWIAFCLLWLCAWPGAEAAEAAPGGAGAGGASSYEYVQEGDKYYKQILYLWEHGCILAADPPYKPDIHLLRKEGVKIIWRVSGSPVVQADFPFHDEGLSAESEEGKSGVWALKIGMVTGVWLKGFLFYKGSAEVKRGEAVLYLYKASLKDDVMKALGPVDLTAVKYSDVSKNAAEYSYKAIAWAVQNGIIDEAEVKDGKPVFRPGASITNGEYSDMVYRYMQVRNELLAKQQAEQTAQ